MRVRNAHACADDWAGFRSFKLNIITPLETTAADSSRALPTTRSTPKQVNLVNGSGGASIACTGGWRRRLNIYIFSISNYFLPIYQNHVKGSA